MSKRKRAESPERELLHGSQREPLPQTSTDESLPEKLSSCTQRFEHNTAQDNAWVLNGNVYGNVVHHCAGRPVAYDELEKSNGVKNAFKSPYEAERLRRENILFEEVRTSLLFQRMHFRYATTEFAQADTCSWVLQSLEYMSWSQRNRHDKRHGCLWIKSNPGAGKSTIMKFLVKHAEEKAASRAAQLVSGLAQQENKEGLRDINVYYFFNAGGDQLERTAEGMYRSMLYQYIAQEAGEKHRAWLTSHIRPGSVPQQWPLHVLQRTFEDGVMKLGNDRLTCYIDALDECDEAQARDIVTSFEKLSEQAATKGIRFRFCFASRYYPHISIDTGLDINLDDQKGHLEDIQKYIGSRLRIKGLDAERIRADLQKKGSGSFMWVVLVVKMLNHESDRGHGYDLRQCLDEIPHDLNKLFERILEPDGGDRKDLILVLQLIVFASRPLHCQELYYAARTGLVSSAVSPAQDGYPSHDMMAKFILHASRGLAELTPGPSPVVQFIHESVRNFFGKEQGLRILQSQSDTSSVGLIHERLKECCQRYISADFVKGNAMTPRSQAELPFLRYAVQGVLHHANAAHRNNVSQEDFVATFDPNEWMALARLADPKRFLKASIDPACIFAEASAEHLLQMIIQRDTRFAKQPGRYIDRIGTTITARKPTDVELLLLGSIAVGKATNQEYLNDLLNMSLAARHTTVMVLLSQHRWTGHIDDDLCLKFLTWACVNGHTEAVELLASHIVQLDSHAYSMLELATEEGAHAVVRLLFAKHTRANLQERRYGRLLRMAAYLGHHHIVQTMLDRGADANFSSPRHGHVIWIAAKAGHFRVVQMLCVKGARVNQRVLEVMSTPLQVACYNRHVETVQILLQFGADVSMAGAEYGTALEAAMYWPHADRAKTVVEILRSRGAVM